MSGSCSLSHPILPSHSRPSFSIRITAYASKYKQGQKLEHGLILKKQSRSEHPLKDLNSNNIVDNYHISSKYISEYHCVLCNEIMGESNEIWGKGKNSQDSHNFHQCNFIYDSFYTENTYGFVLYYKLVIKYPHLRLPNPGLFCLVDARLQNTRYPSRLRFQLL